MRQPSRFEDIAKTVLIFGLLGPPIGGIAAALLAAGISGIGVIPVAMVLSYIFGFVPALLTGMIAGITRKKLPRFVFMLLVVACGTVFSWAFVALTGDVQGEPVFFEPQTIKLTTVPAAISAFVLAFFIRRKA